MKEQKQFEVLKWASLFLEQNKCETQIAEILLQHHLQLSRTSFIFNMREDVPEKIIKQFKADIERHVVTGIPVQHLLGYETFFGRDFIVNEHVLIPRPETEELIMHVLKLTENVKYPLTIADIGTGSGIIAVTLALEISHAEVFATDISKEALKIAKQNANQLDAKLTFFQGDFIQPLLEEDKKVDFLVSNPPYIAWEEEANLSRTVKNFDPELALFADDNGLASYKQIMRQAPYVLKENAQIIFEIGYTQGEVISDLIRSTFPQSKVEVITDINGNDRIVSAQIVNYQK